MNDNTQMQALMDHDPFAGAPLAAFAPITESQREIWLACMIDPDLNIGYNEGLDLRMEGAVDIEALRHGLQVLVDRHESLRTAFSPDGNWLCIQERLVVEVPQVDAPDERSYAEICERVMRTRFDVENGPLASFTLVRRDERHFNLLFVAHHLIVDGWSAAVLLTELGELYSASAMSTGYAFDLWIRIPTPGVSGSLISHPSEYDSMNGTVLFDAQAGRVLSLDSGLLKTCRESVCKTQTGSEARIDDGSWHHLVYSVDTDNIRRVYVDGVELFSLTFDTPLAEPAAYVDLSNEYGGVPIYFGRNFTADSYAQPPIPGVEMEIGPARVHTRAITGAEARNLCGLEMHRFESVTCAGGRPASL